jgi:hypothetical protein
MTDVVVYDETLIEEDSLDTANRLAHELTVEQFQALKVADRDAVLFALLREVAESQRALEMRLDLYEAKLKELGSPQGMQELTQKFLGSGGGILGSLGGMFR